MKPRILFVDPSSLALARASGVAVPGATLFRYGGEHAGRAAVRFVEGTEDLLAALGPGHGGVWVDRASFEALFAPGGRDAVYGRAVLFPSLRESSLFGVADCAKVFLVEVGPVVAEVLREKHGIGEKLRAGEWVVE